MSRNQSWAERWQRISKIAQVDFRRRYYNKKLGLLWALLNPITQIALYYYVFTVVINRSEENYVLFLFSGLVFWLGFLQATNIGLKLLPDKRPLLESVQFDWIDIYFSHIISVVKGLFFNLAVYLLLSMIMGVGLGAEWYFFPLVLLSWLLVSFGTTLILSLIYPVVEDIDHIWSLTTMIGLWVTGIFFSGTFYLDQYTWFAHINPLVGILLNARGCLLEGHDVYPHLLHSNLIFGLLITMLGIFLFRKYAKQILEHA